MSKTAICKKSKLDHCLVTPRPPHYNAPAFTQWQLANEYQLRQAGDAPVFFA
jgi:hypothetical protein